mgnify:CR=1 FL=1
MGRIVPAVGRIERLQLILAGLLFGRVAVRHQITVRV